MGWESGKQPTMEETMKKLLVLLPLTALIFAAFTGCSRDVDEDIELIEELLLNSYFTGAGSDGVTDDGTNNPQGEAALSMGLLAPVPGDTGSQTWVRKIESFNRDVQVDVDGDSAFAVITNHLAGTIYVYNPEDVAIYERPIDDSTCREVTLSWQGGIRRGHWRIEEITPVKVWTNGAEHPVEIDKIAVTSTSGENFEITNPLDFYGRDDVARFTPQDTVTVEVWIKDTGVDAWAYLHHGRHFRRVWRPRRKVFERDDTDHLHFTGTWVTAEDSLYHTPTVRHAAVDVILAETLEGDDSAEYSACAIGFPYVIAEESAELPEDGQESNE